MDRVLVAWLVLFALLVMGGLSLRYPRPGIAAVLAVVSAAWLPVNNGHLEGPTLVAVGHDHGLTVADLFAYLGLALSLVAAWRWRRVQLRTHGRGGSAVGLPATAAFIVFVVAMLGCGLTASWFDHSTAATQVRQIVHHD
jgi:hypothetical protein